MPRRGGSDGAALLATTGNAETIADPARQCGQDDDIPVLTVAITMAPAEIAVRSAQWGKTLSAIPE